MAKTPAAIIFDATGANPVGVILDGAIYRFQVEAKMATGHGLATEAKQDTIISAQGNLLTELQQKLEPGDLVGLATESTLATLLTLAGFQARINTLGQKAMAGSTPVVLASDHSALPTVVTGGGYGGQVEGRAADGAAPVGNPVFVGGFDGTNVQALLTDTLGRLITIPAGSASNATPGVAFGDVALSAVVANTLVRRTAYTEQTSNAQRSIASASANDAAAGTGARTVKIVYYTSTGAGPYSETVTLNGTSYVNTVATDICFIEMMEVVTVGSGGVNAGIITLKAGTAGGGATIGTIAASDNRTHWCHHYVATGKTCYITYFTTAVNGGAALFHLRSRPIGVADAVDRQIIEFVSQRPQAPTTTRAFATQLPITGPARITGLVTTEANTSLVYRCSFDYYDQ